VRRVRVVSTALLLVLLGAAAVLPIAAAGATRAGCHCAVRMACCEDGTCTMDGPERPADRPEWRTCRRETPASTAVSLEAFERALRRDFFEGRMRASAARFADLPVVPPRASAPIPATPPPRSFSF
jgi:hypothetical protein